MPKDDRLYAKFTLDFPDHSKIASLSDAAFRTWMEMIFWSRNHLTDGFIPRRMITDADPSEANASRVLWLASVCFELLHNDDEKPSLIQCENGYQIHDFAEHQTTKAEIEARRDVRKRAGQLGGIASGRSKREAKQTKREAKPKQTRSKTYPETETYKYITPTGLCTTEEHAGRSNGAPAHTNGRPQGWPVETLEEALARAEREAEEIF